MSPKLNEPEVDEEIEDNNGEDNYDEDNYEDDFEVICNKMTACARNNLVALLFYFMRALALLFPSLYVNIDRKIQSLLLLICSIGYLPLRINSLYNTTRHDTIRYDTTRHDTIRYDTIRYDTIRYDTIRYDTIRYDTIRYDTIR